MYRPLVPYSNLQLSLKGSHGCGTGFDHQKETEVKQVIGTHIQTLSVSLIPNLWQ
jgi:hypothetical protein